MIRLQGVGHVYGAGSPWAQRALSGVELRLDDGERVLVAGANGSGKSTLAWILAGLVAPTEGRAEADGVPLARTRGLVAIAFQHARLQLFRPSVASDVAFGLPAGRDGVDDALRLVGLEPERFRDRRVDELSGGEQRRVALAGLLARRPRVLVLDEPLAGLDPAGRRALVALLDHLHHETGLAVVVVSHDLDEAEALAPRLVVLEGGRVAHDGAVTPGAVALVDRRPEPSTPGKRR